MVWDQWTRIASKAMSLQVLYNVANFVSNWATGNFSRTFSSMQSVKFWVRRFSSTESVKFWVRRFSSTESVRFWVRRFVWHWPMLATSYARFSLIRRAPSNASRHHILLHPPLSYSVTGHTFTQPVTQRWCPVTCKRRHSPSIRLKVEVGVSSETSATFRREVKRALLNTLMLVTEYRIALKSVLPIKQVSTKSTFCVLGP
jgi:hypothetical protein